MFILDSDLYISHALNLSGHGKAAGHLEWTLIKLRKTKMLWNKSNNVDKHVCLTHMKIIPIPKKHYKRKWRHPQALNVVNEDNTACCDYFWHSAPKC